jgi:hypothetical protein
MDRIQIGENMQYLRKFLDWHERMCYKFIDHFDITEYHCMWLMFAEGFFLALLLLWIF